jgi:hypothetical protein
MATRLYLPASGAAPASPAYDATWDIQPAPDRRPLPTTKTNTALGEQSAAETNSSVVDVLLRQFVSDQIPSERTIDGTFSAVVRAREGSTAVDGFMQLVVRVVSSDGSTVVGTLYSGASQTTVSASSGDQNEEFPTSSATRIWNAVTLNSVTAPAGSRVVVELGWRACNTATTSHTVFFHLGDPSATGDHSLAAGSTSSLCPWVEFSADLFGSAPITGTLTATLPSLTASLTDAPEPVTGALAATLPSLTATLAGDNLSPITGTLAATLPALTASLAGVVYVDAQADTDDRRNGRTRTGLAYAEVDPVLDTLPNREPVRSMAQSVPVPTLVDGRPQ